MRKRFDEQLKELNLDMIKMASEVENSINRTINALLNSDIEAASQIIADDSKINDLEKEIERCCLKLLLQQQPVATDLRRISSALKIITDMERIGDQSADISELVIRLSKDGFTNSPKQIPFMAKATARMVTESINAYTNNDIDLAHTVIEADDCVDDYFIQVRDNIIDMIDKDKKIGEQAIDLLMVAKYFERIGDHAVNIAEWVVFSITGVHKNTPIIPSY